MTRTGAVLIGLLAASPLLAAGSAPPDPADRIACEALAAIDLGDATGAAVRFTDVDLLPPAGDQPQLCRATGFIEPQVGFEVRMPVSDWNGKLLVTGCSNLCGILQIQGMEDALARGYAAATTDTGHRTGDPTDARWAFNNPALEADFGHRAVHVTTLAAKELVATYYGARPDYSYFRGCSTGGRQALVAAERYPEDFDGIIAGAPFNQSLSVPHMAWVLAANNGPDGKPLLGRAEFDLLGKAVLAACDAEDGDADGIIADPQSCAFDPGSLQCPAEDDARNKAGGRCLDPAQVEAARRIYDGPRTRSGRKWSSGGAPRGGEFAWERVMLATPGQPSLFEYVVQSWLQYLAFVPDPPLPPSSSAAPRLPAIDFDAGPAQFADTAAVAGVTGDLRRFRARGGHLILYHGWADESLMPAHTVDYWNAVATHAQGAPDDFARLFMVPGMLHCGDGPGAADIDYLSALERWVEAGDAPDSLLAYKVRKPRPTFEYQPRFPLAPETIESTRTIRPWPPVPGKSSRLP